MQPKSTNFFALMGPIPEITCSSFMALWRRFIFRCSAKGTEVCDGGHG